MNQKKYYRWLLIMVLMYGTGLVVCYFNLNYRHRWIALPNIHCVPNRVECSPNGKVVLACEANLPPSSSVTSFRKQNSLLVNIETLVSKEINGFFVCNGKYFLEVDDMNPKKVLRKRSLPDLEVLNEYAVQFFEVNEDRFLTGTRQIPNSQPASTFRGPNGELITTHPSRAFIIDLETGKEFESSPKDISAEPLHHVMRFAETVSMSWGTSPLLALTCLAPSKLPAIQQFQSHLGFPRILFRFNIPTNRTTETLRVHHLESFSVHQFPERIDLYSLKNELIQTIPLPDELPGTNMYYSFTHHEPLLIGRGSAIRKDLNASGHYRNCVWDISQKPARLMEAFASSDIQPCIKSPSGWFWVHRQSPVIWFTGDEGSYTQKGNRYSYMSLRNGVFRGIPLEGNISQNTPILAADESMMIVSQRKPDLATLPEWWNEFLSYILKKKWFEGTIRSYLANRQMETVLHDWATLDHVTTLPGSMACMSQDGSKLFTASYGGLYLWEYPLKRAWLKIGLLPLIPICFLLLLLGWKLKRRVTPRS